VAYSADGCVLATTGDYPDPTPLILWDVAYPARPRRTATPFTDLGVDPSEPGAGQHPHRVPQRADGMRNSTTCRLSA
jgi:hypothetical protein